MTFSALPLLSDTYSEYEYKPTVIRRSSGDGDISLFAVQSTVKKFDRLKYFTDNWDGRGSVAPRSESIAIAERSLRQFVRGATDAGHKWMSPHVSSSEDGTAVLEWWAENGKKLTVYLNEDGLEYVKVWGIQIDEEMEDGRFQADQFMNLWGWFSD